MITVTVNRTGRHLLAVISENKSSDDKNEKVETYLSLESDITPQNRYGKIDTAIQGVKIKC